MTVPTRTAAPTPAALVPPTVGGAPAQTVSLRTAARMLSRNERTLRRWINAGNLPATRTPGGHLSIRVADLNAFGTEAAKAEARDVPPWDEVTDEQRLELLRVPRETSGRVSAVDIEAALRFWSAAFDSPAEDLGITFWGARRWRVRTQTGWGLVIEAAEPSTRRSVWQPVANVDADAPNRLRANGFEVRDDGTAIGPDCDVVHLSIVDGDTSVGFLNTATGAVW